MLRALALAAAVLSTASSAHAQAAIEALFSKTEAVTISTAGGCVIGSTVAADLGRCGTFGFGLEALIELSAATEPGQWGVELALGYGQVSGFQSRIPSMDLRGAVRALPSIAAYAARESDLPLGFDEIYLGVNSGLIRMANMQAYDEQGRQYGLAGETFEFGGAVGLYDNSGLFIESSYRIRYFPSIVWTFPRNVETLPGDWPRSLNLSGPSVTLGYQFAIRKK